MPKSFGNELPEEQLKLAVKLVNISLTLVLPVPVVAFPIWAILDRMNLSVAKKDVAGFCHTNHVRKPALFGSVLREDFRPDSDIDVLVEFEPGHTPGLLKMASLEMELSEMFGRKVDLRTPAELSKYFREEVEQNCEVQYAERCSSAY